MKEQQRNWPSRLSDWLRPGLTDLGTVWLGAAAIFLTRAFPSDAPLGDFNLGMLIASLVCCAVGMTLRMLARP